MRAWLGLGWWWPLSRLRLCLANVDDRELQRLLSQRLRWLTVFAGGAALFLVVGVQLVRLSSYPIRPQSSPGRGGQQALTALPFGIAYLAVTALLLAIALAIWLYCWQKTQGALWDRRANPEVCRGPARQVLVAQDGGWPILIGTERGPSLWLTGSPRVLDPIRARLEAQRPDRPSQLQVVVSYYPRSRVIRDVSGMEAESREPAALQAPASAEPT